MIYEHSCGFNNAINHPPVITSSIVGMLPFPVIGGANGIVIPTLLWKRASVNHERTSAGLQRVQPGTGRHHGSLAKARFSLRCWTRKEVVFW